MAYHCVLCGCGYGSMETLADAVTCYHISHLLPVTLTTASCLWYARDRRLSDSAARLMPCFRSTYWSHEGLPSLPSTRPERGISRKVRQKQRWSDPQSHPHLPIATQTILSRIPPNNSKLTYVWENYLFHYVSEGGFTFLVMADDSAGRLGPSYPSFRFMKV